MRSIAPAVFVLLFSGCATTVVINKPLADVKAEVDAQRAHRLELVPLQEGEDVLLQVVDVGGNDISLVPRAILCSPWDEMKHSETDGRQHFKIVHRQDVSGVFWPIGHTTIDLTPLDDHQTKVRVVVKDYGLIFSSRNRQHEREIIEYLKKEPARK